MIDRIGKPPGVNRDAPSEGLIQQNRAHEKEQPRNAKVLEVAKLYEKQFLGEMMKAMRGTITHTERPSMAQNIYQSEMDQQYVESWGDSGGIGLSDLIYEQIMERFFNSQRGRGIRNQGEVELTDKSVVKVSQMKSQIENAQGEQTPLRIEVQKSKDGSPATLKAPWEGQVVSKQRLDGKSMITLDHGDGLRSTMVFNGVPSAGLNEGTRVDRGRTLGVMDPGSSTFLWNLSESDRDSFGV